jgi:1-pyrroline-5-carboxylate dehydrogenase
MQKITYASLEKLGEDFHTDFEATLGKMQIGATHPMFIGGKPVKSSEPPFKVLHPSDTRIVLGIFQSGTRADAQQAIVAARKAFPAWRDLGWEKRIEILRRAGELMAQRQLEFAALLVMEVGKNRFEAIAEVSEAVELIAYYCNQMEKHQGFEIPLHNSSGETTKSVLKPYGVWAAVAPFNFPLALATGMVVGALITGNTVVFKPSSDTPLSGVWLFEILQQAGIPAGVCNFITGRGSVAGEELIENPGIDGFVFTGSRATGFQILTRFRRTRPKPCITEMGGKNPAIIMPSANLEDAVEGVFRSAFGMGGQKCSACSRLYVHKAIYKTFLDALVAKTRTTRIGDPAARETFLGPLINRAAVRKFDSGARKGRKYGRMVYGGRRLRGRDFMHGFFVDPTIVDRLPNESSLWREELFAPLLCVAEVSSLDSAIQISNATEYGLTAGIFTQEEAEQKKFFNEIAAGVVYCNRRGGATTGAWPGVQSFGGWKNSSSTGKNALGPHYLAQFMREQSQTISKI